MANILERLDLGTNLAATSAGLQKRDREDSFGSWGGDFWMQNLAAPPAGI
jgi:hypothetical protein